MQIDEFVLTLVLDPSAYTKGERDMLSTLNKTREKVTQAGKDIESAGKKSAESLSQIGREALTLFGIFAGARGMKDFVQDLTTGDSALGRFAANLGTSPQMATAWGLAVERMGGSAQASQASVQGLFDKLWRMQKLGQDMPEEYWRVAAAGGVTLDRTKDIYSQIFQLAKALQNIAAKEDRPSAANWARSIGMDEGSLNLILTKGPILKSYIESLQDLGATPEQIARAQKLQDVWTSLDQKAHALGRTIANYFTPALLALASATGKVMDAFNNISFDKIDALDKRANSLLSNNRILRFLGMTDAKDEYANSSPATTAKTGKLGSTPPVSASTRASLMAAAMAQLRREGVPEANLRAAAAHLVTQADAESGLNAGLSHDSGTGYGLYGARLGRRDAMLRWLAENGYPANSPEGQMRYMAHEAMSADYPATRGILMGGDSSSGAVNRITKEFENPKFVNDRSGGYLAAYASGAPLAAAASAPASNVSNSSAETHFHGPITVNAPQAIDAQGIASAWHEAFEYGGYANDFNAGGQ